MRDKFKIVPELSHVATPCFVLYRRGKYWGWIREAAGTREELSKLMRHLTSASRYYNGRGERV